MTPGPARERARILLIEDDPDAALFAGHVLEDRGGYQVTRAADVAAALRLAADGPWDLVLTEAGLPGLSGPELVTAVLRLAPATPVAVLTAHVPHDDTAAALRAVAAVLLEKPVRAGFLVATVTGLIGR
jgi:DNA-binding response OmpR family regulator